MSDAEGLSVSHARVCRFARAIVATALCCLPPVGTLAHDALPSGQSEMQIDGKHVRLMMSVPFSSLGAYDTDKDGVLSTTEIESFRDELIAHFLQAVKVRSLGREVQWESVIPATPIHDGHGGRSHTELNFLAKGKFPEIPGAVEVSQRLWGQDYLENQITVLRVSERKVLRREVQVLTQQVPLKIFSSLSD